MIADIVAAVPTPFEADRIADRAFAEHVTGLIREGIGGVSPCGVMGEGPTLSLEERSRLVSLTVEAAAKLATVVPATGTNNTETTVELTRRAKRAGADAVLIVVPYYSRPSQRGIWHHFDAVARAVDIPILIHSAPSRTAVDVLPATVARLSAIPSIVGIVDEDPSQRRRQAISEAVEPTFAQLCGSDEQMIVASLSGSGGCLSSLANIAPALCVSLLRACAARELAVAFALQAALNRFHASLGSFDEIAAIKWLLGRSRPGFDRSVRLPIMCLPEDAEPAVNSAFQSLSATASRLTPAMKPEPLESAGHPLWLAAALERRTPL